MSYAEVMKDGKVVGTIDAPHALDEGVQEATLDEARKTKMATKGSKDGMTKGGMTKGGKGSKGGKGKPPAKPAGRPGY